MKYFILFILFTISFNLFGQIEGVKDTVPPLNLGIDKKTDLLQDMMNSEIEKNIDTEIKQQIPLKTIYPTLGLKELNIAEKSLVEIDKDTYYGPPTELNYSRNPYGNDYDLYALYSLSSKFYITTSSSRSTMPTYGAKSQINAQFNYQATDWLLISGGPNIAKYGMETSRGPVYNNAFGVNGSMKFKLSDRFAINTFGQYWKPTKGGARDLYGMPDSPMGGSMHKSYGGALEYRISDKFGVGAGMERELNPFTGKWVNRPIVYPIFY